MRRPPTSSDDPAARLAELLADAPEHLRPDASPALWVKDMETDHCRDSYQARLYLAEGRWRRALSEKLRRRYPDMTTDERYAMLRTRPPGGHWFRRDEPVEVTRDRELRGWCWWQRQTPPQSCTCPGRNGNGWP